MDENITIEFVRNWIEKHHLTRNSYDTVLSDTLTNNGHYYIDNPYLRDWIKENKTVFRDLLSYDLNENQQLVLEWLKDNVLQDGTSAMCSVFQFGTLWELRRFNDKEAIRVDNAYCELSNDEQFQVLAAYAEWGMKNEQ